MRITIVSGFFLPVPPVAGGSTEKSWFQLARAFAAAGHTVTLISRRWPGWKDDEVVDGVRHLRLPGFTHRRRLALNLLLDFLWSWRVYRALPAADIVIVNAVTLPAWLGRLQPEAGRVVLMTGRMPKGQYRRYHRIARVLAASSYVRARVEAENPDLRAVAAVWGYPIDWHGLRRPEAPLLPPGPVTLGYVGRIHAEKGLELLAAALELLAARSGMPAWRLVICGPVEVAQGGSGPDYAAALRARFTAAAGAANVHWLEPRFDDRALAQVYQAIDVFCYPSLAEQGETFGVAVAEAMAAGAVPVVSDLACFTDFVADGANGRVFAHRAADAARQLADTLAALVQDATARQRLATAATATAANYDRAAYAQRLLADFAQLTAPDATASSAP